LLFPHCHCEGASRPWRSVFLFVVSDGLFSFNSEKGIFRAPARGTFALGGKSTQNAVQTCGLKIPCAASPVVYPACFHHANAVPCKFHLNVALSLLLFSLSLLL